MISLEETLSHYSLVTWHSNNNFHLGFISSPTSKSDFKIVYVNAKYLVSQDSITLLVFWETHWNPYSLRDLFLTATKLDWMVFTRCSNHFNRKCLFTDSLPKLPLSFQICTFWDACRKQAWDRWMPWRFHTNKISRGVSDSFISPSTRVYIIQRTRPVRSSTICKSTFYFVRIEKWQTRQTYMQEDFA